MPLHTSICTTCNLVKYMVRLLGNAWKLITIIISIVSTAFRHFINVTLNKLRTISSFIISTRTGSYVDHLSLSSIYALFLLQTNLSGVLKGFLRSSDIPYRGCPSIFLTLLLYSVHFHNLTLSICYILYPLDSGFEAL